MTQRQRILAVYSGQTPDVVPYMLDLSHWYYHKHKLPWDLSATYERPEYALIDYHKKSGAGFYMPNLGLFYVGHLPAEYAASVTKKGSGVGVQGSGELDGPAITWRLTTPHGAVQRTRVWHEQTYSWHIARWAINSERDMRILGDALGQYTYTPMWDRYHAWDSYVGDAGIVYLSAGYSAMGQLMHYWMGAEGVMYAAADWPDTLQAVIDQINAAQLRLVDLLATSPADVIIMGDNFSSDMQPPHFFARWSAPYYREAIRRLHTAGKKVAVHIDGKLRGALRMIADVGGDCADAVTPPPMGDLTPAECHEDAGPNMILSGGISPDLWLATAPEERFIAAVRAWLDLRHVHPHLIANAGDQVPPHAVESRIELMRELVETEGRY